VESMELKDLKKEYSDLAEKYKLPSFKELNENFEIEKIDKDTEILLRDVRKVMMEKIVNSLGFLEMFLNPMNAPRMYLAYMKNMGSEERQSIEKIYGLFAGLNVIALEGEIDYSEKKEVEIIKEIFKAWITAKPDFMKLFAAMKKPNGETIRKERSYFG